MKKKNCHLKKKRHLKNAKEKKTLTNINYSEDLGTIKMMLLNSEISLKVKNLKKYKKTGIKLCKFKGCE